MCWFLRRHLVVAVVLYYTVHLVYWLVVFDDDIQQVPCQGTAEGDDDHKEGHPKRLGYCLDHTHYS